MLRTQSYGSAAAAPSPHGVGTLARGRRGFVGCHDNELLTSQAAVVTCWLLGSHPSGPWHTHFSLRLPVFGPRNKQTLCGLPRPLR